MIDNAYNEAAAYTALAEGVIETRLTVSVKPESTIYNFVKDAASLEVDGDTFDPVPYVEFSSISSGQGQSADTMDITLDGQNIISTDDAWTVDQVLQSILDNDLRDRPISVGLVVLNPDTHAVIGLIPQFIGFIDNVPLDRPRGEPSKLTIKCSSYRAYAQRRVARVHSNSDHQARFGSSDEAAKWLSTVVFRGGKFPWNKTTATSRGNAGSGGRGGGRRPSYPFDFTDFHLR